MVLRVVLLQDVLHVVRDLVDLEREEQHLGLEIARLQDEQQMQWTLRGAHLLLQTRTKVLNNDLEDVFRSWYPQFHAQAA